MEGAAEVCNENNLIFPLYVGDTPINVALNEDSIVWTKTDQERLSSPSSSPKKASGKFVSRALEWRYVLAAKLGETNSTLEVFFIEKKPKNIWVKSTQKFEGIEVNCRECAQAITQKLQTLENRPRNLLIFVNPVSGTAKNGVKLYKNYVVPLLELASIRSETIVTEYGGHIKKHIQEHDLSEFDGVVVVGGDGTFTEAFSGLLLREASKAALDIDDHNLLWRKPNMRIGIIPAGTGQGMVKAATGSKDVTTAVLHVIVGSSFELPCITVHNGAKFLATGSMLAAYGFFGDTIRDSEAKRGLGIARYPYGMLKTIVNHRQLRLDVRYHPVQSRDQASLRPKGSEPSSHDQQTAANAGAGDSKPHQNEAANMADTSADNKHKDETPEASDVGQAGAESEAWGGGDAADSRVGADIVMPNGDDVMETVDITESTGATNNWVTQTGTYRSVNIFMINIAAAKAGGSTFSSGGLSLCLVKGSAGRFKHVGVILKSLDLISAEGTSRETAEFLEVDRLEYTLKDEDEASLQKLAQTNKREVVNVDGDPYTILHPTVHIRKQPNVMQMFGEHGPEPFRW